jgi:hypothetical protein
MSLYDCVCQSRDSGPQLSEVELLWSGSQDMQQTVSVCSRHPPLLWTKASVLALDAVIGKPRPNAIVTLPIERDNFVKNILPALRCQHDAAP